MELLHERKARAVAEAQAEARQRKARREGIAATVLAGLIAHRDLGWDFEADIPAVIRQAYKVADLMMAETDRERA